MNDKFKDEDGFTLIEILITLVLLAIVGMMMTSIFGNNIEHVKISKERVASLNQVQSEINDSILDNNGIENEFVLVFNEGLSDQEIINITGKLISEDEPYTMADGSNKNITLQYIEVVVP